MMKKTLIAVAAMGLVMTTSCSKEWLEDYKVDPTRPTPRDQPEWIHEQPGCGLLQYAEYPRLPLRTQS